MGNFYADRDREQRREEMWWDTFNAALQGLASVSGDTWESDVGSACICATMAHGFTPDSYVGVDDK